MILTIEGKKVDIKAIGCDWDSTLARAFSNELLPHTKALIEAIRRVMLPLFIATNQGGLGWYYGYKLYRPTWNNKYPSPKALNTIFTTVAEQIGLKDLYWFIATYNDKALEFIETERKKSEEMDGTAKTSGEEALKMLTEGLVALMEGEGFERVYADAHESWRKPRAGMLVAASESLAVPYENMLYIGVKYGEIDTDRMAAEALDMPYLDVKDIQILIDQLNAATTA